MFPALKQNFGSHKFKEDQETVLKPWLITHTTDRNQQGT
jgi:hypothetical protein